MTMSCSSPEAQSPKEKWEPSLSSSTFQAPSRSHLILYPATCPVFDAQLYLSTARSNAPQKPSNYQRHLTPRVLFPSPPPRYPRKPRPIYSRARQPKHGRRPVTPPSLATTSQTPSQSSPPKATPRTTSRGRTPTCAHRSTACSSRAGRSGTNSRQRPILSRYETFSHLLTCHMAAWLFWLRLAAFYLLGRPNWH